jgi:hypothetical protein
LVVTKNNKEQIMDKMKSGISGFMQKKFYGKKIVKKVKDNEKDNGKKETKAHEKAESKKKEYSENN